ncbi:MAG: amino acid permease [Steroidobacteraceae bacterium]
MDKSSVFSKKSLAHIRAETENHGLKRSLGALQLMLLGIGCIIGAGVYVMTGTAAANYAGPAVTISFLVAGAACAFTALCYAELASTLPVSGSSYTYTYAALGEVFAWGLGWLLMLEYGLAGSALAVGLSGYLSSLLADFQVIVPESLRSPMVQSITTPTGTRFALTSNVNLVAVIMLAAVATVLIRGVSHSAAVNAVMVVIKVTVLLIFVAVGVAYVNPVNWHPLIPPNEGGFQFGVPGILRAASILFFAYLGFETVSTAALEARNPQRDMPIGILGALIICTVLYIMVALVLTGLVPYRELGVADPIAVAMNATRQPALAVLIKSGAVVGLTSVLLVNTYGHSRICFAMSRDGMLPRLFSDVHARWHTPHRGTMVVAGISAVAAATLPISILGDLVSLGTAAAFSIVAISVMWLRTTHPQLHRPFRVPLGGRHIGGVWVGIVPLCALLLCLGLIGPVLIDIIAKAMAGDVLLAVILGLYLLAGALIYVLYCRRASRVQRGIAA